MPHFSTCFARLLLFASVFLVGNAGAQHTVDGLQNIIEALEAAGVSEFSLAQEASKRDGFLEPIKVAGLVPVRLARGAQRVTGGAPAVFFARIVDDAVRGNRGVEDVEIRKRGPGKDVQRLFNNDKACGRYETIFWDAGSGAKTTTLQRAKADLARALKAEGYRLLEAEKFNAQFEELAVLLKDFSFGPGQVRAVLTDLESAELEFEDAKGWLLRTSQEEKVSPQLIERFEKTESVEELLELSDRLPEPGLPELHLFSARRGQTVIAGAWGLGNTTLSMVRVVKQNDFLLSWCNLDRNRWE